MALHRFYITTVYNEMNQPCAHWARSWFSHYGVRRNPVASGGMVRLHSSFFRAKKLFMIIFCLSTKKKNLCKMNLQTETSFDVSCWQCLEYIGCSNKNCKVVYESAI